VGARFSAPAQTGPGAHPASCAMGTGSFSEVKSGRGVTLTPHPFLVPWSIKSRAIPLLPLWAVRPVQSLSACTGVQFKQQSKGKDGKYKNCNMDSPITATFMFVRVLTNYLTKYRISFYINHGYHYPYIKHLMV